MMRVLKIGGRAQHDPTLVGALASAAHVTNGELVVVHGGGDEVDTLQRLNGVAARFIGGRRITSALDLEIIRMALSGSANKRLVAALVGAGVRAVGISGEDAGLLRARLLDADRYGYVGVPTEVDVDLLRHLLRGGFLPVVSPVSRGDDASGSPTLNVNGDDAAAAIALALGAHELVLVSDVEGVRVDGEPVASLDEYEARGLIDSGVASGGMGAKLESALAALAGGVERVRISDISAIGSSERGTILTRVGRMCT